MDRIKKVSFVIPCYRSEHTLPHVVKEIRETMQRLTQYTYDIFLVNDASPDNTMGTIRELCEKYDNIKGIGFARNFGQHAALMAGLRHSDGDYVVCLDDDGQTPRWISFCRNWTKGMTRCMPAMSISSIPHSGILAAK